MPQKKKDNGVVTNFCLQRSRLWHDGIWEITNGLPNLLTQKALRKTATEYVVPANVVIPCLQTFRMEGLIMCIDKNGKEIPFSTKESDYEQFILTPDGSDLGPNYPCK